MFLQAGGYSTASLVGLFTYSLSTAPITTPPSTAVGLLDLNGAGAIAGYINTNNNGVISGQQSVTGVDAVTLATVTTSTRGLATLTISGASTNFVFYPISNNSVILMTNGIPAIALMVSQY